MALRLTESQVKQIMPRIPPAYLRAFVDNQGQLDRFGITASAPRFAMWLANVAHECGEFHDITENGNYTAQRICQVWPSRFKSVAAAAPYAHNPQKLFSNVYGNRMGNGPEATGEGYKFRGRGLAQVTGKDGYKNVGRVAGLDLIANPDAVNALDTMMLCGGAFWAWKDLNRFADNNDFYGMVGRWNGGHIGMSARNAYLAKCRRVLGQVSDSPAVRFVEVPKATEPTADVLTVQTAQKKLRELGYWPGNPNGDEGAMTRDAVLAFQADNHMELTGKVDAALMEELAIAGPRRIPEARAKATEETLKEKGSETVSFSSKIRSWGKWLIGGGAVVGAGDHVSPLDKVKEVSDQASTLQTIIEPLQSLWGFARDNIWILLVVGGFAVWLFANHVIKARVEDERTGANRGR